MEAAMYFRQLLNDKTACASYLFGCKTHSAFAVVDPHVDLVDEYVALAEAQSAAIVAVLDTHVQADHVSGLPELVVRTGATAYLPEGAGVEFAHHALRDGEIITLGNTEIAAIATPGHALAHHAYLVTDHTRGEEPWFVLTGDALLVGDAGRPDLHAHGEHTVEEMARVLYRSLTERLLTLPDDLVLYPSHYSGSVCGRGLSANPVSTIGFERRNNGALQYDSEDAFVWALALPVPLLIAVAPSWAWIVAANVLLGINQGLAWSMTVVMKIDLVGPQRRGLALGLNEAAGYGGVAVAAALSGWLAGEFVPRDVLVVAGAAIALIGFALSVLFVRDTAAHVAVEQSRQADADERAPSLRDAFRQASYGEPALRACSQAGLVNNLNDALAWGLVPLFLAAHGAGPAQIGLIAGLYPAVWGAGQIWTGHWSDRVGRKPLIVAGMLIQSAALTLLAASGGDVAIAAISAVVLGLGTALVYPTLIAAISDAASPVERAPA